MRIDESHIGKRVCLTSWPPGISVSVTGIGEFSFLAKKDGLDNERPYLRERDWEILPDTPKKPSERLKEEFSGWSGDNITLGFNKLRDAVGRVLDEMSKEKNNA